MPAGRPRKIAVAPPSDRQLEAMKSRLEACESAEFAAVNVGIPKRVLNEWIRLGRMGKPEFVPFVDMIDKANANLAANLMATMNQAVREGNLAAVQWLYKVRVSPHETRFLEKQFKLEDELEEVAGEVAAEISEEDIAAAEARAMAALEKPDVQH